MILEEHHHALLHTLREFSKKHLEPYAEKIDEDETVNPSLFTNLGKAGLLGLTIDEAYGGSGLGAFESLLAMETMGEYCASSTLSYLAHSILCANNIAVNANESQKKKYLPRLISGELIGAMAITEPGAGSDALNLSTKGTPTNGGYFLNGTKMFITNGPIADVCVVYAKTGPEKKDISTFILEKTFKGFSVGKKLKKMGMKGSSTSELILNDCFVPEENRIGALNASTHHMMNNLNLERITISGISLGIAKRAFDIALKYSEERKQFNTPLNQFEMIQDKLATMYTNWRASRALVYELAQSFDKSRFDTSSSSIDLTLGSMAKLSSGPMAVTVALESVQILGGYGYMREFIVERLVRDAKLMEIGAGTNEIMKLIIARSLSSE